MRVTNVSESISSGSLHYYTLDRNGTTYWATTHRDGSMGLAQRYTGRDFL